MEPLFFAKWLELVGIVGLGEFRTEWACVSRFVRPVPLAAVEEPKSVLSYTAAAGNKKIAHVPIVGMMSKGGSGWFYGTSTIQARRDLQAAVADPEVAGIMLGIDSPGGYVSGTDDLAREVRAAKKAKPVWAAIDDLGASAAYWVASQADRITANSPTAMVGSIGTYQTVPDVSKALEAAGIKMHLIATGALKGAGSLGTPVTEDHLTHFQSLVNAVQDTFDQAVREGRSLSAKQLADVRHGGVMTADAAKSAGLIDAVQSKEKTLREFAAATKGGGADYRKSLEMFAAGGFEINATGDVVQPSPKVEPRATLAGVVARRWLPLKAG